MKAHRYSSTRHSYQILIELKFSERIFLKKKLRYKIFMKISPMGVEVLHANKQT